MSQLSLYAKYTATTKFSMLSNIPPSLATQTFYKWTEVIDEQELMFGKYERRL